jgi:uncharacterized repeat protein (TIGR03803 family)
MTNREQNRASILRKGLRASGVALAMAVILASTSLAAQAAQGYKILYTFTGGADGDRPGGDLIRDAAGNFYGAASYGGSGGWGTVFKLDARGDETVLYNFPSDESQGSVPKGALALDAAGSLYGTTYAGGAYLKGTIFKVDPAGTETMLHSFNGSDGSSPSSGLIRDSNGNLYGTTFDGGTYGCGVVFRVDATGEFTVLHHLALAEGCLLFGSLVRDAAGNLYGTGFMGGTYESGTAFKLDVSGTLTVLHDFSDEPDAARPNAGLLRDGAGNLYGTTQIGGVFESGAVFKIDAEGTETVLYSFTGGADGSQPLGRLIRDAKGSLYGTTSLGGASGQGTVFKLDSAGVETVLHSFRGRQDSGSPFTGLTPDGRGTLSGTTLTTAFEIRAYR